MKRHLLGIALISACGALNAASWTYRGTLEDGGRPANGQYDVRLSLLDESGSTSVSAPLTSHAVTVSQGQFADERPERASLDSCLRGNDERPNPARATTVMDPRLCGNYESPAMLSDELGGLWLHGSFSTINGQTCRGPVRLLIATQGGIDPAFSCNRGFLGGGAMAFARDSVYVKGLSAISRFRRADGGSADPDWVIANPPTTLGLSIFGDRLYAHGDFSALAGANRQSLAAFSGGRVLRSQRF